MDISLVKTLTSPGIWTQNPVIGTHNHQCYKDFLPHKHLNLSELKTTFYALESSVSKLWHQIKILFIPVRNYISLDTSHIGIRVMDKWVASYASYIQMAVGLQLLILVWNK